MALAALDGWARYGTIRAKDAAVPWFWAQCLSALAAGVEELAGIDGHGFALGEAAVWTGEDGFNCTGVHGAWLSVGSFH